MFLCHTYRCSGSEVISCSFRFLHAATAAQMSNKLKASNSVSATTGRHYVLVAKRRRPCPRTRLPSTVDLCRTNGNGQHPYGGPQQSGDGRHFASRFGPALPQMQQMQPGMGMGMGMGHGTGSFSGMMGMGGPPMPPRAPPPPPPPPPPPQPVGPRVAEEFMVALKVPPPCRKNKCLCVWHCYRCCSLVLCHAFSNAASFAP